MDNIYIGIDPGQTGAIAFLKGHQVEIIDCPETISEMVNIVLNNIRITVNGITTAKALIEKVNPFYKSSAKSAFTFGCNFCSWQAILACFHVPYEFITPRKWQKEMFDSAKRLDDTKKQSFERASRLFPNIELKTKRGKILDGRCDALLLAELCRRQNK